MNNTFFNNLINFPDVNFDLVLFYILHLTSFANRITGWYLGVGEGRVYATGVPSADKNFVFKTSMPYKLFTYTSTLVPGAVPSFSSMKLLTTRHYSLHRGSSIAPVQKDNFQMDPHWVTGFVDGEGCFHVEVKKKKKMKTGWALVPHFHLVLHKKDIAVLEKIKKILGVGKISPQCPNKLQFQVQSQKDLVPPPSPP